MTELQHNRRAFLTSTAAVGVGVAGVLGSTTTIAAEGVFVIPAPARVTVPVVGSAARLAVRRVYCLGLNYAAHTREIGQDPDAEPPFFFMKPTDAIVTSSKIPYASKTKKLAYEVEFVIVLGTAGSDIPVGDALNHVYGYAVGLDMTRRDLQAEAVELKRPWVGAKSFDHSAPCSAIRPAAAIGHPEAGRIWLELNGETRQDSNISLRIWNTAKTVSVLSEYFRLEPGDLIFTGTIPGSDTVKQGDVMRAGVDGVGELTVEIV